LAVDTGSADATAGLLASASDVVDGVIPLSRDTGFGDAVRAAVAVGVQRWGDPGRWIWLLHDDCAPSADCLGVLLSSASVSPSAVVLGPLALDWAEPRLVIEAGLSTDASGHRQTGIGPTELDWSGQFTQSTFTQSTEVLAVPSAGALIRRDVWTALGGYDPALPLLRDDLDFGWRVNRSGGLVLCVPAARLRHARAVSRGLRPADALSGVSVRAADRAHGLRTVLVNRSLLGLPRLLLLTLLRALGFALLWRISDARAELFAVGYLIRGQAGLRTARAARPAGRPVRGLLTSRTTRLRNTVRGGLANWIRRRAAADAALTEPAVAGTSGPATEAAGTAGSAIGVAGTSGSATEVAGTAGEAGGVGDSAAPAAGGAGRRPAREPLPTGPVGWLPDDGDSPWALPAAPPPAVGPDALPAGALGRRRGGVRRTAGLRRPSTTVAVSVSDGPRPAPAPSPVPRDGSGGPIRPAVVLVEVGRRRIVAQLLLAPPVLLFVGLALVSLLTNADRLGVHLAGGALSPAQGLGATWSGYLASWHAVAGGTAAPAPATLAVIGVLGSVLGGPPVALAVLLLGDAPIAGVLAYAATRHVPVRRWVRALIAAGYALLPPATAAVAQGRLDVVIVHILLPPVLVGVVTVLNPPGTSWLAAAAGSALGLAVIGAFAPLVHALVIVFALVGFVVVPGGHGDGRRRVAALFAIVLLPLALLVPWPAVVLAHPSVLLGDVPAVTSNGLDPGGPASSSVTGVIVLVAAVVGVVLRPRRAVLPGLAVAVLGAAAVWVVTRLTATPLNGTAPAHFWTGGPMVVVGAGLAWALLGACRTDHTPIRATQVFAAVGAAAVLALAVGDVLVGRQGPLRDDAPTLAPALAAELSDTGRSVLVLATAGQPAREAGSRMPAFGDDDIALVPGAAARLAAWNNALTSGDQQRTKAAVAQAATAGVLFVVLPDQAAAGRFTKGAGDLASAVGGTSDGRPVVRLQPASGAATLISPALAKTAVTGDQPPTTLGAAGISPVDAAPPDVDVRVSEGGLGRLLVLAAEDEDAWQATVDGQPAPIVRAWGHLVAVSAPTNAADVRVYVPSAIRDVLLLVQAAVLLFTALTAIPGRR
jgi:GT2 family glycosyltransferase